MFISDSTESIVILLYKQKIKGELRGKNQKNANASNFTVSNLVFITGS